MKHTISPDQFLFWITVSLVVITSAARLTRLATFDRFPPVRWLRDKYADVTDSSPYLREWQILAFCGYCASFGLTALVVWAGYYWNYPDWWWLANGTLGGSYLAAILMAHDGDDGEHEDDTDSEGSDS